MADVAENARRTAQGRTSGVISPLALEAVRRIDALFEIERSINGHSAERRRVVRQELSAPLVADLESWLREQRAKLPRGNDLATAMDYMLKRWAAFTRFLGDGRICLSNNAAERALRGIALGRKVMAIRRFQSRRAARRRDVRRSSSRPLGVKYCSGVGAGQKLVESVRVFRTFCRSSRCRAREA